jgi:hypothetical protein
MEVDCPGQGNVFVFDSRDSTWDGTQWIGIDGIDGNWVSSPVTFWDDAAKEFNAGAFNYYIYGPERNAIFSGLNADGTAFVSTKPSDTPLNKGFNPAPSYFAAPDDDVDLYAPKLIYPNAVIIASRGWAIIPDVSYFMATKSPNQDDKGSMRLTIEARCDTPTRKDRIRIEFSSFQYDCLLWGVGTSVAIDLSSTERVHFFAQGVRKGYADSNITEISFVKSGTKKGKSKQTSKRSKLKKSASSRR